MTSDTNTKKNSNLKVKISHYEKRIQRHVMPFGQGAFGNLFCIGIIGSHRGQVFYWDHELELGASILTRVSVSFDDFIQGLALGDAE